MRTLRPSAADALGETTRGLTSRGPLLLLLLRRSRPRSKRERRRARARLGGSFYRQLGYLFGIAFRGREGRAGGPLLAAQLLLLLARTQITVKTTQINVYFLTKAISQASWKYWVRWLSSFTGWTVSGVVVNSGLKYVEAMIQVHLRRALTRRAHQLYLRGNAFYAATVLRQGGLDQIDQHIAADIDNFSSAAANIYGHSFKPLLEFILSLREASKDLGYARVAAVFALNGAVGTALRMAAPKAGRLVAREAELEGTFRHAHSRLIAHSEEVAFLRGQAAERTILDETLQLLSDTKARHQLVRIKKNVYEQFMKFFGLLSGGVFVHVPFLLRQDMYEGERISNFRATEEQMLKCGSAFTELMLLGTSLQELAGYTQRMYTMLRALEAMAAASAGAGPGGAPPPAAVPAAEACIEFAGLSVAVPGDEDASEAKRLLVKDLTLRIGPGTSVLVTGPNGCGKTSLFRCLAGLWPAEGGRCSAPGPADLLWLPQKPYLVLGTLRDQVAYPTLLGHCPDRDAEVEAALAQAGLGRLVARARDAQTALREADLKNRRRPGREAKEYRPLSLIHEEWADVLSGGERQRIGFARLYFHAPKFAVLDEATSAINPDEEQSLYAKVLERGTTVLSIAHRLELRKLHQLELAIAGDGSGAWTVTEL